MKYALCQSFGSSYAQSGNWANGKAKNPVYIGTTLSGSFKYVGQWMMPSLDRELGVPKNVMLNIYRNGNTTSHNAMDYYIGCSESDSDSASVLSTGCMFTLNAGEGWQFIDVSGIGEYISQYDSTWCLLIGNPNTRGTYAEIGGYGSGCELYLDLMYSNGSRILLASDGELVPYRIYHAEYGQLVQYELYHGKHGELIKY